MSKHACVLGGEITDTCLQICNGIEGADKKMRDVGNKRVGKLKKKRRREEDGGT